MATLFPGEIKNENNSRIIAHLDMDAFFAAIEERDRPEFRGLPIVIGSDPKEGKGRGVVSTANYVARKFGIHSAMPISTAWRLAEDARRSGQPKAIFLEGNHKKYSAVSRNIMNILRDFSSHIEEASVDEAYIDLSASKGFDVAVEIALKIKEKIFEKEKLTASVGLSFNKLLAKIASDIKKPDGLTVVKPEDAQKFLDPLPVRKIPGVGPKTEETLLRMGIKTIQDLRSLKKDELQEIFGKWGGDIFKKAMGIDNSPIAEEWEAKSIGEQETFEVDILDPTLLLVKVEEVSRDVFRRFTASGFKSFKTIVVTVRFSDFSTKARSHTLEAASREEETLVFEATKLFMPFLDGRENARKMAIRLIGIRIEKLS